MMMTINTEKDIEGPKVKKGLSLYMDVTYYKIILKICSKIILICIHLSNGFELDSSFIKP